MLGHPSIREREAEFATARDSLSVRAISREVPETDIAWLAGILDGEGWVGLTRQRRRPEDSRRTRYPAYISISSTSWPIMDKVKSVMEAIGVTPYFTRQPQGMSGRKREGWQVRTGSLAGVETALRAMLPYLTRNRPFAELVLEYLDLRKDMPMKTGRYDERPEQLGAEFFERIRAVRYGVLYGNPSQTVRGAPADEQDDETVGSAWRHAEDGGNDRPARS